MKEVWDAYDKNFNILNVELTRGDTLKEGYYHLVTEIIVKHIDGTYLLMQRDYNKNLGGKWELTAGGSALKGESPIECAKRELYEETGIKSHKLIEVKRIVHEKHQTLYVEYYCLTDCDKKDIVLQDGETIDYKWIGENILFSLDKEFLASDRALPILAELRRNQLR